MSIRVERKYRAPERAAAWLPTGALYETFTRTDATIGTATLTSGTVLLTALPRPLRAGVTCTSITFVSSSTAISVGTNQWFVLVKKSDLSVLRATVDDTSTAWGTNAAKTLALSSTYTPAADVDVYVGIMVAAATPPTLRGVASSTAVNGIVPITTATSSAGQTTAPANGATLGALTASANAPYAYIS